jgi:isopentenyl diphosphate isomerase/L-lactate dehydrogenase-like FMN-dependent dehydrogenase
MIISSATDFREAARRKLPPFLFHYLDGGAGAEQTLRANVDDLQAVKLRQRVLRGSERWTWHRLVRPNLRACRSRWPRSAWPACTRAAAKCRRCARPAAQHPLHPVDVSVCPLAEVAAQASKPIWFQLYVLKDRGFMRDVMRRAWELGATTLVFTVDMPVPGARYRDAAQRHERPAGPLRRMLQAMLHPRWAWDVGLFGRPHDLGNISAYRGSATGLRLHRLARRQLRSRHQLAGPAVDPRRVEGEADHEGHPRPRRRARCAGLRRRRHRRLEPRRPPARRRAVDRQVLPSIAEAVKGKMTSSPTAACAPAPTCSACWRWAPTAC